MIDFAAKLRSPSARLAAQRALAEAAVWKPEPEKKMVKEKEPEIILNEKQAAAMEAIAGGQNIMITGNAGTGKSALLNAIKKRYYGIQVTGSTGISAMGVGGSTLHSWAGLGLGKEAADVIAKRQIERKSRAWYAMKSSDRLAIDEISMIDAQLFEKLNRVLQIVRKNERPFGGMQLILLGDFCQLPSVGDEDAPSKFAFETEAWLKADIKVIVLTEQMRQKDREFAEILAKVRVGDASEEVRKILRTRINAVDPDPTIAAVVLATHNSIADSINAKKLEELPGEAKEFAARDWTRDEYGKAALDKNCIAPTTLTLKIGAQVMLLTNLDVEGGLVNGSLGIVQGFSKGGWSTANAPIVKFSNGVVRELERFTWNTEKYGEKTASREQYPLRLSWSITIHKVQGMTLDKVRVHLKRCFAPGQAYVAMSRARTLEGLYIADISGDSIKADPVALEFYRRYAA